jgi:hypothetical protein
MPRAPADRERSSQPETDMSEQHVLARKHLDALLAESETAKIPIDVAGRAMLAQLIETWLVDRSWQDVSNELRFTADSLDPDTDFEFMRP